MFFGIALISILYPALPYILSTFLKYQLVNAGATGPVVVIDKLGLEGARITEISFHYSGSQHRIELKSEDITLTYSFSGLLSGQLEQINVSRAHIAIDSVQAASEPATKAETSIPVPSIRDIPFQSMSVEHVQLINRQAANKAVTLGLTANIQVNDEQLKAQLSVSSAGRDKLNANLFVLGSGDMRLLLYDPMYGESLLDLSATGVELMDSILKTDFTATMDLEKITALLDAWGIEYPAQGVVGSIMARGNVSFPVKTSYTFMEWLEVSSLQANMDINFAAQRWSDIAQQIDAKIPLNLNINGGSITWNFDHSSRLSFIPLIIHRLGEDKWLAKFTDKQRAQVLHFSMPDGFTVEAVLAADQSDRKIKTAQAIHLQYGNEHSEIRLNARLLSPHVSLYPSLQIQASLQFAADSSESAIVYADTVHAHGKGMLAYHGEELELSLQPDTMLSVTKLVYADVSIQSLSLKLISRAMCQYRRNSAAWKCNAFDAEITAPQLNHGKRTVSSNPASVHVESLAVDNTDWQLNGHMNVRNIALTSNKQTIKVDRIRANVGFSNSSYNAQARLHAANGALQARLDMRHSSVTNKGRIDYRLLPVSFNAERSITDALFERRSYPLQLKSGMLKLNGQLTWKPSNSKKKSQATAFALDQNTDIEISQVTGSYDKITFMGLNAAFSVRGWKTLSLRQPVKIHLAEVNPGIAVTAIRLVANMEYAWDGKQVFTISDLNAQTLGGEIRGKYIDVDMARKNNPFTLTLHQLDIAELLELEQNQGVYGSGYIDGELPFDLGKEGLFIRNGKIKARPPGGKLQYQANERVKNLAKSNANIDMLLRALKDFNYNTLDADADYYPDGKVMLKVRLKGSNPQFQNGRAVHLNVNVEENVLQLIRSIQLGDAIQDQIGERVLKRK